MKNEMTVRKFLEFIEQEMNSGLTMLDIYQWGMMLKVMEDHLEVMGDYELSALCNRLQHKLFGE